MILRVGLTGGIASGKSTVARLLESKGCAVIDSDRVVRDLYQPGQAGHQRIVSVYGTGILDPQGQIDRARLASRALADRAGAERLNGLIHPLVAEGVEQRFQALENEGKERIVVVEATLLLEAGTESRYHRIVVVDVDPALQVRRGEERGMAREDVLLRISRQMDRDERLRHADYVVRNDGDRDQLASAVEILYRDLELDLEQLRKGPLKKRDPAGSGVS